MDKKLFKLFFLSPDDGIEVSNAALDLMGPVDEAPPETSEGDAPSDEPAAEPDETTTPPVPAFDPNAFANQFAETFAKNFKPPTTEPPKKEMTREEAEKLLNVWKPSPEWLAKLNNMDTQAAALEEMRDGILRQAVTIAQGLTTEQRQAIDGQYAPVLSFVQQQEGLARDARFNKTYPALAKPEYRDLITGIAQALSAKGLRFSSESEAFKAVATGAEAILKQTNPEFKLGAPASASKSTPPPTAIPTVSGGQRGGGAAGRPKVVGDGKNKAVQLLGKP